MPADTTNVPAPPEIPRLSAIARHAFPRVVEASVVPFVLFYGSLHTVGLWMGLVLALLWSWGVILVRAVRRQRVSGLLALGVVALTARTVIALLTGSVFVYFLQPTLGTVAVAVAFASSVVAGRPLAARLAADLHPLPEGLADHEPVRRFFGRVSIMWAVVHLANAAVTLWVLTSQSIAAYLMVKAFVMPLLTGSAMLASVVWFRRTVERPALAAP